MRKFYEKKKKPEKKKQNVFLSIWSCCNLVVLYLILLWFGLLTKLFTQKTFIFNFKFWILNKIKAKPKLRLYLSDIVPIRKMLYSRLPH